MYNSCNSLSRPSLKFCIDALQVGPNPNFVESYCCHISKPHFLLSALSILISPTISTGSELRVGVGDDQAFISSNSNSYKHFALINSFNQCNDPTRWVILFSKFFVSQLRQREQRGQVFWPSSVSYYAKELGLQPELLNHATTTPHYLTSYS